MRERASGGWLEAAALGAVFGLSAAAALRRIWAADFWWQYAAGRWVAEHGIPKSDAFSYTATDRPWTELHWLFCVVQSALMDGLGPSSLVVLKWAAVVAAFAIAALPVASRGNRGLLAAVTFVALMGSSQRFFVRPELVTYVLVPAFAVLLDRFRRRGGRSIWLLPVLEVVWVNTHPMALLGPLLVGLAGAVLALDLVIPRRDGPDRGTALRRLRVVALLFCATSLAVLVNPYGTGAFELPLVMFSEMRGSVFATVITELRGPASFGLRFVALRWFWVLVALAGVAALANLRRLDPFWTVLCASQLVLALTSVRNLPLFCIVAVPFVVQNLAGSPLAVVPALAAVLPAVRRVVAAGVVLLSAWYGQQMLTDRFSVRQNDSNQSGLGIAEHRFPVATAQALERIAPGGRVFGTLLENSYLVSRGVPVFADPRLEVYGEAIFVEFLRAQVDPDAFRAAVARYDIRAALLDLQAPLCASMSAMPGWRLVAFDPVAALFLREDAAPELPALEGDAIFKVAIASVRDGLPPARPWSSTGPFQRVSLPGPYLALADFLVTIGRPADARPFLDEAAAASPFIGGIHRRRARLLEMLGEARGVVEAAAAALDEDPRDYRTMARLGEAWYRLDDNAQAARWLEASLAGLGDRALTWSTLGRIRLAGGDLVAAERCLARAVELEPTAGVYRANLARIAGLQGRTDEAIAGLEDALALDPANVSIYRDLVELNARAGRMAEARRQLESGLRLAPADPELQRLHATLLSLAPR